VRALLLDGADPNELATASFAQVTPLGTAATFGANEIAEILLDHGADTEKTADHGNTPLHSAAANGNRSLVELLLARGANAAAQAADGRTPADLAVDEELRALLAPV
jgi:ankyrin repeat protein